jgi:peptidoglycan hydrolase CwlO-like protein
VVKATHDRRHVSRPRALAAPAAALCAAPARTALLVPFGALILALALTLLVAGPAVAAEGVFTIEKIEKAPSVADLQREAKRARAEMTRLRARLEEVSAQYDAARARLDGLNRDLTRTRLELTRVEAELESQRAVVAQRLVAMYKAGEPNVLDVIAGFSGFAELESNLSLLKRIAASDEAEEFKLEQMTKSAEELAKALDGQRAEALVIESEIDDQRAAVATTLDERRALLEGLTEQLERALAAGLPASLMKAPPGGHTPVTWAKALMQALGMPQTTENMAALIAWEMAEGGHWYNSAHYNPLNTTWRMPGATAMNSVGVKAYLSWAQGLAATVNTFHNGLYEGILAALHAGNDAQAVADAVATSPWGTNSFDVASLVD